MDTIHFTTTTTSSELESNNSEPNLNNSSNHSHSSEMNSPNPALAQRHLSFSVENILAPGRFGHHHNPFSSHLSAYDDGRHFALQIRPIFLHI